MAHPLKDNQVTMQDELARIICGTVLSGELSLVSAHAACHLVKSKQVKHVYSYYVIVAQSLVHRSCLALSTIEDNEK